MDDPPNSNRKRPRPDKTRDNDLYFEDGSVILSATDTDSNLVYFRVHKSVLARQSTVFRDLFSLPTPSEMDLYDGLPLIHVHDNAKELKEFLQVMYDPSFLPFGKLQSDTPALVASPLKLATKYQADNLRNRIASHLAAVWPTTLHDWDDVAYAAVKQRPDPSQSSTDDPHHRTIDFCPDRIPFISLARESGLPDILTTAFYSLSYDSRTRGDNLSRMTRGDLEMLMLGRECIMRFIATSGFEEQLKQDVLANPRHVDPNVKECQGHIVTAWTHILRDIMCGGDPLAIFRTRVLEYRQYLKDHGQDFDPHNMCAWCKKKVADGLDALRGAVFDALPTFFPLQSGGFQV